MSTPFYVSPEQLMQDRADFAQKGIARGRSVVALQYADGVLLVAENASQALHKVSEIYDRIAFAAVGRYNEFENLRIAGVRLADMRGYAYDRRDVTARGLANAYAQTLGTIFSSGGEKPYEVEIFVAEVGRVPDDDQIYRLTYQGQVADQHGFAVMGGQTDSVTAYLRDHYAPGATLSAAVHTAVAALGHTVDEQGRSSDRVIPVGELEVAVLDRTRPQPRKFARIRGARLTEMLGDRGPEDASGNGAGNGTTGRSSAAGQGDLSGPTTPAGGDPAPAEKPATGSSGRPAVAPPGRSPDRPPVAPDPAHPGDATPPAPQPDPETPARPEKSEQPPTPPGPPDPAEPGEI